MSVPERIAAAAINKTLRCAVEADGALWPIAGGQSLSETPGSANIESTQLFLIRLDFPGEEQAGQFQFNWGLMPGSRIDQMLIDAGRNKTKVALDFRAPGALKIDGDSATTRFTIDAMKSTGHAKGLSEIWDGDAASSSAATANGSGWAIDDTIRVGNVIELVGVTLTGSVVKGADQLIVIAAIKRDSDGDNPQLYVKGRADKKISSGLVRPQGIDYTGYRVYDPNVRYRVSGTGVSFATDSSGAVPIGQLTMTVDAEPVYELILAGDVDRAYQYAP